jgi:hypothetical protein
MRIKKSKLKKLLRDKPKRGALKKSQPYFVWLGLGHQVSGWRIVWAFTGRKWATYKVANTEIRKRMRLSDWNALRAEEIV